MKAESIAKENEKREGGCALCSRPLSLYIHKVYNGKLSAVSPVCSK